MDLDILAITGTAIVCSFGWHHLNKYLDNRPKNGGFVDPRPSSQIIMDGIMEGFNYDRYKGFCPYPNPNPDNLIGIIATKNNYFKSVESCVA